MQKLFTAALSITFFQIGFSQSLNPEIETALEVKVPTKPGFVYELLSGQSPGSEVATGRKLTGTGSTESFLLPRQSPRAFYRVRESEGPLAGFISGLTKADFSNSRSEMEDGILRVSNVRVESTALDRDDLVSVDYEFDPGRQGFVPTGVEVCENAGPAAFFNDRFFPLADGLEAIDASSDGTALLADREYNVDIPAAGLDLDISLKQKQVFAYELRIVSPFKVTLLSTDGEELSSINHLNTNFRRQNIAVAFKESDFTMRFTPIGNDSANAKFIYLNGNRTLRPPLTNGSNFSVSIGSHAGEYVKFPITLEADQKIILNGRFTGGGGSFLLSDQDGKIIAREHLANATGGVFELNGSEKAGEHFLIFYGEGFENNGFSGSYSVESAD